VLSAGRGAVVDVAAGHLDHSDHHHVHHPGHDVVAAVAGHLGHSDHLRVHHVHDAVYYQSGHCHLRVACFDVQFDLGCCAVCPADHEDDSVYSVTSC